MDSQKAQYQHAGSAHVQQFIVTAVVVTGNNKKVAQNTVYIADMSVRIWESVRAVTDFDLLWCSLSLTHTQTHKHTHTHTRMCKFSTFACISHSPPASRWPTAPRPHRLRQHFVFLSCFAPTSANPIFAIRIYRNYQPIPRCRSPRRCNLDKRENQFIITFFAFIYKFVSSVHTWNVVHGKAS